ncbi:MAG TPA: radical SAM protein, partial [Spirochaetota bacterium]|nr:radical SAM protein [Spirochaetota bacterium]
MKRKILLVYPEIPATYWSFKYVMPFVGHKSLMPPLGLITVAAMLPEDYDLRLIDMNIQELNGEDITAADLVFVSAMIVQKESFHKVVRMCNRYGVPVVAGGPYPTTGHESIRGVDHFVLNEGEITLPRFIADLEAGRPQKIYRDETKPDITKTPPPRFDLLDLGAYGSMAVQSSRGCPFNCEFCDIIEMFGRVPRYKLPEQFIREMDLLYETGYRGSLFIVDDNFIGNKKKVRELLDHIIEWQKSRNYPFSLYTEASINLAEDDGLLDRMVAAGLDMVFIGIETPVQETLEHTNKMQNTKSDIIESISKIQEKGIEVMGGFIVGFDTDPENIFDLQIEFIQKAGIPLAMIGTLIALPGTQL